MKVRVTVLTAMILALGLVAQTGAPPPAYPQDHPTLKAPRPGTPREQFEKPRPTVPAGPPLKAEQLTKEQFNGLPDDQVIDLKGQRMTARELRAKMKQAAAEAEAKEKETETASQAHAKFEAHRAKFQQEQKAKLDAENAKVQAEVTRLRQQPKSPALSAVGDDAQLNAIRQEARQLLERSKTASPAEQQQIEQRAGQLLQQLKQMGVQIPAEAGPEQQMAPPMKGPEQPQRPGQSPQPPAKTPQRPGPLKW